jgi:hypothetical protein
LNDYHPPVRILFEGIGVPDLSNFQEDIARYSGWSEDRLVKSLPVAVTLPESIFSRLSQVEAYLSSESWPPGTHPDAKSTLREFYYELVPDSLEQLVQGVRTITASARREDGSRAVTERDAVLRIFLEAKIIALARTLKWYVLTSEAPIATDTVQSNSARRYAAETVSSLQEMLKSSRWTGYSRKAPTRKLMSKGEGYLRWIESSGGPLILAEAEVALSWMGVDRRTGDSKSDYDRSTEVDDYLGLMRIPSGDVLVLGDEPSRTSVLSVSRQDAVIIRWRWAESERTVFDSIQEVIDTPKVPDETLHCIRCVNDRFSCRAVPIMIPVRSLRRHRAVATTLRSHRPTLPAATR